jgi:3-methylfumaryl-CoA hydratase
MDHMTDVDIEHLQTWVGRRRVSEEILSPTPARALAATLDHDRLPDDGDPLPPLWHWIYFTPLAPQSELGRDGHPRLGGFMPPIPFPRRMWAGGRLTFPAPLRIGERAQRETEILKVNLKSGQQGALLFVTLRHRLSVAGGLAVEEEQDIVYREPTGQKASAEAPETAAKEAQKPDQKPAPALWRDPVHPSPTLLFRYSALTFNAHRIHYDLPYAQDVEGYPGLVVHGPLTATLLADRLAAHVLAGNTGGRLSFFSYRGQRPLFAGADFTLCGNKDGAAYKLWAETPDGAVAMSATATVEE